MIGIDLFSGAGGMSVGAQLAGITVLHAVEADFYAAATYQQNHSGVNMIQRDIRQVTGLALPEVNEEIIVFGGPPCQGFSTSNQKTRSVANPDNWLFTEYLRIVREINPHWVVFENVKGILETDGGSFFDEILQGLNSLGYTTSDFVLNAMDFGVPQNRSRLFVIGSREGVVVEAPIVQDAIVTVAQAINDLPVLENGANEDMKRYGRTAPSAYAQMLRGNLRSCSNHLVTRNAPQILERYSHIPQGGNWENIPQALMQNYTNVNSCHTGIYRRLQADKPSVVIGNFRKNMLVHPWSDRGLSVREAARLQSFPDSFTFVGSIGFQQQQVGNAVPPLLAQALFSQITEINAQ